MRKNKRFKRHPKQKSKPLKSLDQDQFDLDEFTKQVEQKIKDDEEDLTVTKEELDLINGVKKCKCGGSLKRVAILGKYVFDICQICKKRERVK